MVLSRFDAYLTENGLAFDGILIGGAALCLLGVISRPTKDCDVLFPSLPPSVLAAAASFAKLMSDAGCALQSDWLNNGPASLAPQLPPGWEDRVQPLFTGKALRLHTLGRLDLLRSKLFALCDRGLDLPDCVALNPTPTELAELLPWLELQDGNPDGPAHVRSPVSDLTTRLGHVI